jgi:hypothetical protein
MDARDGEPGWWARLRALARLWPLLFGALAFRYACYAAMMLLALWNEGRAAPALPDALLDRLPYVACVDRLNYWAWLAVYLPLAGALLLTEPRRWARYMVTGGLVSLARGVCVALTTLGPPDPASARAGVSGRTFWQAWSELVSPVDVFAHGSIKAWLSQDLFFSGHAATTLLLALYLWHRPVLRWVALLGHAAMVAAVLLARLHYSIDVVGAWAVTFAIFALREWRPREAGGAGR